MVTITGPEGAVIRYNTSGYDLDLDFVEYGSPFILDHSSTVYAIAIKNGVSSDVASKSFINYSSEGDEPGGDDH